jgi:hypothetical protein
MRPTVDTNLIQVAIPAVRIFTDRSRNGISSAFLCQVKEDRP